jgi:glucose-6-phosphate-specific signal transduction histidine kinase
LSTDLSRYNPKLFYWVFLPCDVFSLCLQAAGGGLSTTTSGKSQTGIVLALVGLVFQVVTLVIFCFFFADYLFRYYRSDLWKERFNHDQATRLKIFLAFMAFAILNILARCSYRLAELHQGYTGDMIRNEGLFIWLEGV